MKNGINILKWVVRTLLLVVVILVLWWLLFAEKDNHIAIEVDDGIDVTPQQIESVRAIGQWEFLSITTEELVDTVRKGFISDDHLARIYYGTLRLGIDMSRVQLEARGDTVVATLPRVTLLDPNFIDEARTKAFFESGNWKPAAREALYRKARRQMLKHSLTRENLATARQNADAQLRQLLRSMGYNNITITWNN
jgi:hypothetical protein